MKKIALLLWTIVAISSLGFAGGDFETPEEPQVIIPVVVDDENGNFYAGLGLVYNRIYSAESEWFDKTPITQDETGGFTGILGYDFNEYIAAEGRITKTFFKLDYADMMAYSIFMKPQYPVAEDFKIYGLLGFGLVQVDAGDGKVPAHADKIGEEILNDTSFQWGFGASYAVTEHFSVFAEYSSLAKDADIDLTTLSSLEDTEYNQLSVDGITIGLLYNF